MPRTGNARSWRRPGTAPHTPAESCYYTTPMSTWAHRPSDLRWHWGNAYVSLTLSWTSGLPSGGTTARCVPSALMDRPVRMTKRGTNFACEAAAKQHRNRPFHRTTGYRPSAEQVVPAQTDAGQPALMPTSAIHTKVESSLIIQLSCGNTLKSPWEPAPFGCGPQQAFPQVSQSAQSRS